jgi:MoaA/NifB/PqqE/SkfB family radical SAM enzyme
MIYQLKDIRHVHLEISSMCNAECPLCPRNFFGYPINNGYQEHSMTLAEAQKIFTPEFLLQLTEITINGNFGDIVMCPEALDIVEWFRKNNPETKISISTNAGARDKTFWQTLAQLDCDVHFCIDGLEDTHSIYRRNTLYDTVIKNAKTFIAEGGRANWKFIVFDHNQHQIETARQLSKELGFIVFEAVYHGRTQGPVFNHNKELVFYLGKSDQNKTFDHVYHDYHNTEKDIKNLPPPKNSQIDCKVKKEKSIYINSLGEVYPCCWLGFNPKTFGGASHFHITNGQIKPLIENNSALHDSLENTIQWFDRVEESWDKKTYQEGLLFTCNNTCA